MASTMAPTSSSSSLIVFVILFLYSVAYSLLIPALPKLVSQYAPGFGVSSYYAGPYLEGLSAVRYAAEFFFCAYLGYLSDRGGRKRFLIVTLLINAAGKLKHESTITFGGRGKAQLTEPDRVLCPHHSPAPFMSMHQICSSYLTFKPLRVFLLRTEFTVIAINPSFEILGITKFMRSSGAVICLTNTSKCSS